MRPDFDDPELFRRLDEAAIEWLDGRTCEVMLDQNLAKWLVQEARRRPMPEAEVQPYIDQIPNFGHEPITIFAGLRTIDDGSHRVNAVAASGRAYVAIIHVTG